MSGLNETRVLDELARIAVSEIGDYCFIDLLRSGPQLERVAFRARDSAPASVPGGGVSLTWNAEAHPALAAMRNGVAELRLSISDVERARILAAEGNASVVHDAALHSFVVAPISIRDQAVGALTICYAWNDRQPADEDLIIAQELASGTALALDNARLRRDVENRAEELSGERARHETVMRDFLATVSHELRSPLAAMLLWEKILRTAKDDAMRGRAIEAIHQSVLGQYKMIEDLLDLSRCVSGKLEIEAGRVAIAGVFEGALEAAMPMATAKRLVLEGRREGDLGTVLGDPARLRQVIGNLLSNAIKFTDAGGRVTVTARQSGGHVEIAVADTGRGIPAAQLPFIFKPFQSRGGGSGRPHPGLGLGLAMVAQLVDLHRGSVTATSDGEGLGATFTISLPVASEADDTPAIAEVAARASDPDRIRRSAARNGRLLKGLRVLVVDDEPRVRQAITLVLRDAGSRVTAAASAAEAFAALRVGRWDAVVSDIGMPEEDGYSLIRRVRELPQGGGNGVGAVALTGYARPQDQSRAIEAGFNLHLTKPVEAGDLIRAVATVAGRASSPPM